MTPAKGRILVIRGGAIGDFILTLPAISALRQQFPAAYIEILGYPHIAQLALAGGLVDRVQSIEAGALAGFFARNGTLSEELAEYFFEFNVILSYLYDPDGIFRANVARCTKAQFIQGPHRPDEAQGIHATQVFLQPLERLAIFDADHVPRLSFKRPVTALLEIALHPGSGSEQKNWPEEKWAELLQHLVNSTRLNLLLIGGEAEGERLQRLAAALPPKWVRVAQSLPLAELGNLLQGCVAFLGHDSGISHLAAALGLPGILLWGDTSDKIWRPPADQMLLLHNPNGLAEISVADVVQAITKLRLDGGE